ncbi:MAG: hypothetical protein FWG74_01560 [Planctomycetes bacterium]|nr:hypothetical protein [Planctomycetota bacterium]
MKKDAVARMLSIVAFVGVAIFACSVLTRTGSSQDELAVAHDPVAHEATAYEETAYESVAPEPARARDMIGIWEIDDASINDYYKYFAISYLDEKNLRVEFCYVSNGESNVATGLIFPNGEIRCVHGMAMYTFILMDENTMARTRKTAGREPSPPQLYKRIK